MHTSVGEPHTWGKTLLTASMQPQSLSLLHACPFWHFWSDYLTSAFKECEKKYLFFMELTTVATTIKDPSFNIRIDMGSVCRCIMKIWTDKVTVQPSTSKKAHVFCSSDQLYSASSSWIPTIKAAFLLTVCQELPVGVLGGTVDKHARVEAVWPARVRSSWQLLPLKQFIYICQNLGIRRTIKSLSSNQLHMNMLHVL